MIKVIQAHYGNIKQYLFSILKAYIVISLGLGISSSLIRMLKLNDYSNFIINIIYNGFIPAILCIILLIVPDLFQKIKNFFKYKVFVFDNKHARLIVVDENYTIVFDRVIELLSSYHNFSIEYSDSTTGSIICMAKRSWKSLGETVSLEIEAINDNETKIEISSLPKNKWTLIDYCKNFENVEKFVYSISRIYN